MIKHIPNILTIIRFIFIPSIVLALVYDNYLLALILFTLSSFTDILDGKIARKRNKQEENNKKTKTAKKANSKPKKATTTKKTKEDIKHEMEKTLRDSKLGK